LAISTQYPGSNDAVIKLPERFDFNCVHEFRDCYEKIDGSKYGAITVDFSSTRLMDSSALGMLINFKKYFEADSVKISLSSCNSQIQKIFDISNFEKLFDFK